VRKIYSKLNELLEKVIEDNDAASQLFTSLGEKLDSMSSRLCVKDDSDISNGRAVLASRRAFRDYLREMSEVGMFDVEEAIKRSEVLDLMKLREKTVDKNLQRLCEEGFLIKTGLGEYRPSNMTLALHRAGLLSL
jgi:phosphosulfolactate synthase (CoM biosynthesis protein A)